MNQNAVWIGGTGAMSQRGKNARVAVAFARMEDSRLAFRVEIENHSLAPILVEPARFYYATCTRDSARRTCKPSRLVTNPEQVLLALDMNRSRERAIADGQKVLLAATVFLSAMAGLATVAAAPNSGSALGIIAANAVAPAIIPTAATAFVPALDVEGRHISAYELERANWSLAALRKTTILPAKWVSGLVFVEFDPSATEIALQVRIADEILPFRFSQALYPVVSTAAK